MSIVSRGFRGRRGQMDAALPPGQYFTDDFPVLQTGPTPRVHLDDWRFTIRNEVGADRSWTWGELQELPSDRITVDIQCVTKWSKLQTSWKGVSLDVLLEPVETAADFAVARSYSGYTTNLPLEDLVGGRTTTRGRHSPARTADPCDC